MRYLIRVFIHCIHVSLLMKWPHQRGVVSKQWRIARNILNGIIHKLDQVTWTSAV